MRRPDALECEREAAAAEADEGEEDGAAVAEAAAVACFEGNGREFCTSTSTSDTDVRAGEVNCAAAAAGATGIVAWMTSGPEAEAEEEETGADFFSSDATEPAPPLGSSSPLGARSTLSSHAPVRCIPIQSSATNAGQVAGTTVGYEAAPVAESKGTTSSKVTSAAGAWIASNGTALRITLSWPRIWPTLRDTHMRTHSNTGQKKIVRQISWVRAQKQSKQATPPQRCASGPR